jgi:hypothetical protein
MEAVDRRRPIDRSYDLEQGWPTSYPQNGHIIHNDSPEGHTKLISSVKHTEKMVYYVPLKSDGLEFLNIFSADEVTMLCSVDL